jgi:oxygen-independent coproporphyrinogen-3 oxidase
MLMCDFRLDLDELRDSFGDGAAVLAPAMATVAQRFGDLVVRDAAGLRIQPESWPLTRIIAAAFDAYTPEGVRYSHAS